ncbi:MAG: nucleotidyltransferase domain-containing protein [Candidatus Woesearchaeota archaeon]|nr:nucleotidyltransferase domain-containing protein [Candidatus Woesearchaeota archaeon]
MIQNYSKYRILQEFFDFPMKQFHLRELSRRTNLAQPSVLNHLKALMKDGFIIKEKTGLYPTYRAQRDTERFKTHKKAAIFMRLFESGLIDALYDACMPDTIVLFGSVAKGEDTETSDIDLFVQAPPKKVDLTRYEKILHRTISLFFEERFSRLSPELKNNMCNGIILKGYLKVF